jgi:hypothetical protein
MKLSSALCTSVAALVLQAGCQRFRPPPLSGGQTAAAFESCLLSDPELKRFHENKAGISELAQLDAQVKAQPSLGQLADAWQRLLGELAMIEHERKTPVGKEQP